MKHCNEPKPVFGIQQVQSNKKLLAFTVNGLRVEYDMTDITKATETKTEVDIDFTNRDFIYKGESRVYKISAKSLAGIMHLSEIGDISVDNVEDGSLLIYDGENAKWTIWKASANTSASLDQVVGVNSAGNPAILNAPGVSSEYYFLAWAGGNKVSFIQPSQAATAPVDSSNKVYPVYLDPLTKQLVTVPTAAS